MRSPEGRSEDRGEARGAVLEAALGGWTTTYLQATAAMRLESAALARVGQLVAESPQITLWEKIG